MSAMTDERIPPGAAYTNVAEAGATVDTQIGQVHGNVYVTLPGDPPQKKFEVGRNHLQGGMPRRAEELIGEAFHAGLKSSEIAYYWALATFADRTLDQIGHGQIAVLRTVLDALEPLDGDGFSRALRLVRRLIDHVRERELRGGDKGGVAESRELDSILDEIEALPSGRVAEIGRHLQHILVAAHAERFLSADEKLAAQDRLSGRRVERAWMFFEADPVEPQEIPVAKPSTLAAWVKLSVGAVVGAVGFWFALPVLVDDLLSTALGLGLLVVGIGTVVRYGLRRRIALDRVETEEDRFSVPEVDSDRWKPTTPWERWVRNIVRGAFSRYAPTDKEELEYWKWRIQGLRLNLTRELVETYAPLGVRAASLGWLARWHAEQVAERWPELREPRDPRGIVPRRTIAALVIGIGVTAIGLLVCLRVLWEHGDFADSTLVPALIAMGVRIGCDQGCRIYRCVVACADATKASRQRYQQELAAYEEWCKRLEERPTDAEMARWLDADKRFLRAQAMRLYDVPNQDLEVYFTLSERTGGREYKERERGGPLRFSRYIIKVLLLTKGGVRFVEFGLDMTTGAWEERERRAFRYDTIASMRVTKKPARQQQRRDAVVAIDAESDDSKRRRARPSKVGQVELQSVFEIVLLDASPILVLLDPAAKRGDDSQDASDDADRDDERDGEPDDRDVHEPFEESPRPFDDPERPRWDESTFESYDIMRRELEASGVASVLATMEGISADGRTWLEQRKARIRRHFLEQPALDQAEPAGTASANGHGPAAPH